ncbi:hypothetical protein EI94DRAFT_1890860 [Lactarius quietus]|nr:hypothetical protein EI94DRAFT_1890860 [Lactarius quietus]
MAVLESDDRERVSPLRALQIRHASPNEIGKATKIKLGKRRRRASTAICPCRRDITSSLNAETVDLRRDVRLGDHGLHVGHRHGACATWTMPKKSAMGLKAAGDQSHGVQDAPQPFTVSMAVLHHTGPSIRGFRIGRGPTGWGRRELRKSIATKSAQVLDVTAAGVKGNAKQHRRSMWYELRPVQMPRAAASRASKAHIKEFDTLVKDHDPRKRRQNPDKCGSDEPESV